MIIVRGADGGEACFVQGIRMIIVSFNLFH